MVPFLLLPIVRRIWVRADLMRRSDLPSMINVPAVAFKDILQKHEKVDFVKMDVEGGEYKIILGTPCDDLARIKCIALEYHRIPGHDVAELVEHLKSASFSVVRSSRGLMLYGWQERGLA
jgi:hypothetical protein